MTDHEARAREVWRQHGHLTRDHMHDGNVVAFISAIASALREAEAGEREACAKIADEHDHTKTGAFDPWTSETIAKAIRDRGGS